MKTSFELSASTSIFGKTRKMAYFSVFAAVGCCLVACGSHSDGSIGSSVVGNDPPADASGGANSSGIAGAAVNSSAGATQLNVIPTNGGGGGAAGGDTQSGGGTNGAVQCNGKFSGRLRDFTVAQDPSGQALDLTAVPPVAEAVGGVNYVVSPDFEFANAMLNPNTAMGKRFGPDPGLVAAALGPDQTPVYAGPATGTVTTTGPTNFATWFHDTAGVNLGQTLTLQFLPDPSKPTDPNAYYYDSSTMGCGAATCPGFFPIDGLLLGNEGNPHNYHMTFELHLEFKYHAGEVFTFIGDDDIWVFVDDKLALDLGGTHNEVTGQVVLDSLGLTEGQTYPLSFFWCERHVVGSNLRIETSLEVTSCGDPVVR